MENTKFHMPIDEVLYLRERGLIVVGKIESGDINIGDNVRFETSKGELIKENVQLNGIEVFGQITTASKGMIVGLFFQIPYIKNKDEGLQVLPIKSGDIIKK